jgi:hypothetical protein
MQSGDAAMGDASAAEVPLVEHCILCGVVLSEKDNKRRKAAGKIKTLLETRWAKTAFVWRIAWNICNQEDERRTIAICMPCVHWATRTKSKPMCHNPNGCLIPLDHLIMFSMAPFDIPQPDERLFKRLARNMVHTVQANGTTFRNCYTHLLEPCMFERLQARSCERGHLVDQIIATWWDENMNTVFVSNALLAKNIRRVCQADIERLGSVICGYNP